MKKIFYAIIVVLTSISLTNAQQKDSKAPPCIQGPNIIEVGTTYTYTSNGFGQCSNCYDWDESSPIVSFINPNNDQTSSVQLNAGAPGTFNLDLTYFGDGGCRTCTKTITVVQPQNTCDDCVRIDTTLSGNDCVSAFGYLNNCLSPNIESVEWSWDLFGQCGTEPCPLGTVTTNDHPSFNSPTVDLSQINLPPHPVGYFIIFYAKINYTDKTFCEDSYSELLTCWNTSPLGGLENLKLYPNPTSKENNVSFKGIDFKSINNIEIFDASGNSRAKEIPAQQSFNIKNLPKGLYIVKFTTTQGEVAQKKLIIE